MQINNAIVSCNNNPLYLDFWPLISKVWKLRHNINPILVYVSNSNNIIDTSYGEVIRIATSTLYDNVIQSQFARIWYASKLKDEVCILSDIDMFPLSTWYFNDQLKSIDENKYVNLTPTGFNNNTNPPLCYNIAKGFIFKDVLDIDDDFESFLKNNISKSSWSADEEFLGLKRKNYIDQTIFHIIDSSYPRIDRSNWRYDESNINLYADCHSLRPYAMHKNEIDNLINKLV